MEAQAAMRAIKLPGGAAEETADEIMRLLRQMATDDTNTVYEALSSVMGTIMWNEVGSGSMAVVFECTKDPRFVCKVVRSRSMSLNQLMRSLTAELTFMSLAPQNLRPHVYGWHLDADEPRNCFILMENLRKHVTMDSVDRTLATMYANDAASKANAAAAVRKAVRDAIGELYTQTACIKHGVVSVNDINNVGNVMVDVSEFKSGAAAMLRTSGDGGVWSTIAVDVKFVDVKFVARAEPLSTMARSDWAKHNVHVPLEKAQNFFS